MSKERTFRLGVLSVRMGVGSDAVTASFRLCGTLPAPVKWRGERRATNPTVSLELHRDELTVHRENAVLVSVALPDRTWFGDDPLDELRGRRAGHGGDLPRVLPVYIGPIAVR